MPSQLSRVCCEHSFYRQLFPFDIENRKARHPFVKMADDWLITQFEQMNATQRDVTTSRNWKLQMGNAAKNHGLTIQVL